MIIADTSIIIDYWKNPSLSAREVFEKEQIYICGIITAELLHGAKNDLDFQRIRNALSIFSELPLDNEIWIDLGNLLFQLRKKGFRVPFQDALLSTIALRYDCSLWTLDKHFLIIQSVEKKLKLFTVKY